MNKVNLKIRQFLLLSTLAHMVLAANVAYVPKVVPGNTQTAGAGKQWPDSRFVVDSSGNCMIDNLTGLMWARNAGLFESASWGDSNIAGTAQYKVKQMNNNSNSPAYHLCGYDDWRLPNIREINSLINYGVTRQASWLRTQGFINVASGGYWSSTAYNDTYVWIGIFLDESSSANARWNRPYKVNVPRNVWPVRGGR